MTGAEPTGFLGWVATYGQYVGFFIQLVYYVVISAAAVFAAIQFKRLVDNACGVASKKTASAEDRTVSVEEFTD